MSRLSFEGLLSPRGAARSPPSPRRVSSASGLSSAAGGASGHHHGGSVRSASLPLSAMGPTSPRGAAIGPATVGPTVGPGGAAGTSPGALLAPGGHWSSAILGSGVGGGSLHAGGGHHTLRGEAVREGCRPPPDVSFVAERMDAVIAPCSVGKASPSQILHFVAGLDAFVEARHVRQLVGHAKYDKEGRQRKTIHSSSSSSSSSSASLGDQNPCTLRSADHNPSGGDEAFSRLADERLPIKLRDLLDFLQHQRSCASASAAPSLSVDTAGCLKQAGGAADVSATTASTSSISTGPGVIGRPVAVGGGGGGHQQTAVGGPPPLVIHELEAKCLWTLFMVAMDYHHRLQHDRHPTWTECRQRPRTATTATARTTHNSRTSENQPTANAATPTTSDGSLPRQPPCCPCCQDYAFCYRRSHCPCGGRNPLLGDSEALLDIRYLGCLLLLQAHRSAMSAKHPLMVATMAAPITSSSASSTGTSTLPSIGTSSSSSSNIALQTEAPSAGGRVGTGAYNSALGAHLLVASLSPRGGGSSSATSAIIKSPSAKDSPRHHPAHPSSGGHHLPGVHTSAHYCPHFIRRILPLLMRIVRRQYFTDLVELDVTLTPAQVNVLGIMFEGVPELSAALPSSSIAASSSSSPSVALHPNVSSPIPFFHSIHPHFHTSLALADALLAVDAAKAAKARAARQVSTPALLSTDGNISTLRQNLQGGTFSASAVTNRSRATTDGDGDDELMSGELHNGNTAGGATGGNGGLRESFGLLPRSATTADFLPWTPPKLTVQFIRTMLEQQMLLSTNGDPHANFPTSSSSSWPYPSWSLTSSSSTSSASTSSHHHQQSSFSSAINNQPASHHQSASVQSTQSVSSSPAAPVADQPMVPSTPLTGIVGSHQSSSSAVSTSAASRRFSPTKVATLQVASSSSSPSTGPSVFYIIESCQRRTIAPHPVQGNQRVSTSGGTTTPPPSVTSAHGGGVDSQPSSSSSSSASFDLSDSRGFLAPCPGSCCLPPAASVPPSRHHDDVSSSSSSSSPASRAMLVISDCCECSIYITFRVGGVKLIGCKDTKVVLLAVDGVVSVASCSRVTLHAAAGGVRVENCYECSLNIYTPTRPLLLGDTRSLTLAPYNVVHSNGKTLLKAASLQPLAQFAGAWAQPIICSPIKIRAGASSSSSSSSVLPHATSATASTATTPQVQQQQLSTSGTEKTAAVATEHLSSGSSPSGAGIPTEPQVPLTSDAGSPSASISSHPTSTTGAVEVEGAPSVLANGTVQRSVPSISSSSTMFVDDHLATAEDDVLYLKPDLLVPLILPEGVPIALSTPGAALTASAEDTSATKVASMGSDERFTSSLPTDVVTDQQRLRGGNDDDDDDDGDLFLPEVYASAFALRQNEARAVWSDVKRLESFLHEIGVSRSITLAENFSKKSERQSENHLHSSRRASFDECGGQHSEDSNTAGGTYASQQRAQNGAGSSEAALLEGGASDGLVANRNGQSQTTYATESSRHMQTVQRLLQRNFSEWLAATGRHREIIRIENELKSNVTVQKSVFAPSPSGPSSASVASNRSADAVSS